MLGQTVRATRPAGSEGSKERVLIVSKLGRVPDLALQALDDYGLTDQDIGRYFSVTPSSVRRLRRALGTKGPAPDLA